MRQGTRRNAPARIITPQNLKAYMTWRGKPWKVDDILYERLPMLAVRNYLNSDDEDYWPLCWNENRSLRLGLAVCVEALKGWQAFRGPLGVAETTREGLSKCVPGVVRSLQGWLREYDIYRLHDAIRSGETDALIKRMARAAAKVSACKPLKTPNPMLGSKILHFFFPEFFPVWDTAWIKKTIRLLSEKGDLKMNGAWEEQFGSNSSAGAARQYAQYLDLMLSNVRKTSAGDMAALKKTVVSFSARKNKHHALTDIVDDNLWDMSPILFEMCLIGCGRAAGVLRKRR
jgi:hypothetical protein